MGIEPIQFAADSSGRQIKDCGVRLLGDSANFLVNGDAENYLGRSDRKWPVVDYPSAINIMPG
ncbi:MAG: hypothetical protein F6K39_06040 [Okeania sp. SIO3B3]|nr:hypothetical protein [Okeania sp. SIO3B3]